MKRRTFIVGLGATAASWPLLPFAAHTQQRALPVIGFLNSGTSVGYAPFTSAFRAGLNETGYVERENVAIEYRWAEGDYGHLPALAADLVRRQVTVIAATSTPAALAAKAATSTIPIVFTAAVDPIAAGLVASLSRPNSNATGVSQYLSVLGGKRLELLHEFVPNAAVIGMLVNPKFPDAQIQTKDVEEAARLFGQQVRVVQASTESEFNGAFATLVQQQASALVVATDALFLSDRDQLVALAARHKIPSIYPLREYAMAGGLMSYAPDIRDGYRQAAIYVGRILKGAKPGDLPVVQPTKFEFLINLKTAKALGLEISPKLLALADEVIE
jgi:putative tryptophan/tyrosine transport system substrate-binding protein